MTCTVPVATLVGRVADCSQFVGVGRWSVVGHRSWVVAVDRLVLVLVVLALGAVGFAVDDPLDYSRVRWAAVVGLVGCIGLAVGLSVVGLGWTGHHMMVAVLDPVESVRSCSVESHRTLVVALVARAVALVGSDYIRAAAERVLELADTRAAVVVVGRAADTEGLDMVAAVVGLVCIQLFAVDHTGRSVVAGSDHRPVRMGWKVGLRLMRADIEPAFQSLRMIAVATVAPVVVVRTWAVETEIDHRHSFVEVVGHRTRAAVVVHFRSWTVAVGLVLVRTNQAFDAR